MEEKSLAVVDEKTVVNYMTASGIGNNLSPNEKKMFIEMATLFGLNPFKREIYCTVYGSGQYRTFSLVTGYEVYLKRAERTGKLDGYEVDTKFDDKGSPICSTATIYRKDWSHPFKHTVYYTEYVQKKKDGSVNKFWSEKPITMLEKVAKAQAFRLCFPDEFDGMPYTREEMPNMEQTEELRNVTPPAQEQQQENKIAPEEDFKEKLFDLWESNGKDVTDDNAKNIILNCLQNGGDYRSIYGRFVNYLYRKGIKVA